ncbi:hypothetical protein K470DRAFT_227247 [Piedraia hortae CBS 480.64]|uniref:PH domain-containing protein n=1 Tax=Piedraia hortae CBS 480.64 TaxID=1314780 RepID=A0A6A7C631_9PEZI|nr:hypothetical protein K470DRAFT_227247 [Piedraia hortae CBS 480.64]
MADSGSLNSHKRSKSAAVSRAIHRMSTKVDGSQSTMQDSAHDTLLSPTGSNRPDSTLLLPGQRRTSTQSLRPAKSMSVSSTSVLSPTSPVSSPFPISNTAHDVSIDESVKLFKIYEALRSGDTVAVARACRPDDGTKLEGTTCLHLAIQCAEDRIIDYVLAQQSTDINARDREGNTALHLASMLGRASVVKLLLEQPSINDTVTNHHGKVPIEVARNADIFQQLQLARSLYIDNKVREIQQLATSGQYDELERLLSDPKVQATTDVNGPELASDSATTESGGTLLHEAARKKDIKLAQILLINGADPFQRDRKGKLPQDVTKDERTRAILKKSPAAQVAQRNIQEKTIIGDGSQVGGRLSVDSGPGSRESREFKGFLRKWTNYTGGYKLRWFVLEDGVLSYYKNQDDAGSACRGAINMRIAKLTLNPKDKLQFEIQGKSSVKYQLKANHEVEAKRWFWTLNNAMQWAKDEEKEEARRAAQQSAARHEYLDRQKTHDDTLAPGESRSAPSFPRDSNDIGGRDADSITHISRANTGTVGGDDDDEVDDDDHAISGRKDAYKITAQSAMLQLDLLEKITKALQAEQSKNPSIPISNATVVQALESHTAAIGNLKGLVADLLRISRDHEVHWQQRLEREQNIRALWEESMARIAKEQQTLEHRIDESETKRRRTKKALKEALEGTLPETDEQEDAPRQMRIRKPTIATLDVSDAESGDEQEFFDALDAGEVEVVDSMPPTELTQQKTEEHCAKASHIANSFKGYEDGVRKRLKIDADNRPKVSLWGVLKSMIGKDMTKMTLPVSFNEPTSLLYRVVEDMEYTDLLDVAAKRTDSTERMVYVAGFAASEYASTIGRVAKPFNPLLGETFEYVRPDLGYRFFIEQVSHHPPVGAAFAESPRWDYYGESAVKSKFYGKSFEFNPLGTWFLHLRPASGGEELYTWKKVTSSVVGILTGNPVVDNYGTMEIKNWTTGEICYLDFKPTGWKASSAYQVTGRVLDTSGQPRWSIGGRWSDKIYARFTPGYEATVEAPTKSGKNQAFLIWEVHPRPSGIPFNITPFVVTFNALPDRLLPYIAPTDSRLRPDQRAMEEGEYDLAATEKNRLEEAQRARRRNREAKGEEFEPKWFTRAKHPITGEGYWKFNHEYWRVRDDVAEGKTTWREQGLEEIF